LEASVVVSEEELNMCVSDIQKILAGNQLNQQLYEALTPGMSILKQWVVINYFHNSNACIVLSVLFLQKKQIESSHSMQRYPLFLLQGNNL
jgi:hypothetical protein